MKIHMIYEIEVAKTKQYNTIQYNRCNLKHSHIYKNTKFLLLTSILCIVLLLCLCVFKIIIKKRLAGLSTWHISIIINNNAGTLSAEATR